jgi:hypothetical protein
MSRDKSIRKEIEMTVYLDVHLRQGFAPLTR